VEITIWIVGVPLLSGYADRFSIYEPIRH